MASIKIVLRKKANKDGTFPLALRITKDRRTSYIYLGHNLSEKDWDAEKQHVRKSHPNSVRLNNLILKKQAEASDTVIELDAQHKETSSAGIKRKIRPAADMLFFARAELFRDRLEELRSFHYWRAVSSHLRVFKEFVLGTNAIWDELSPRGKALRPTPLQGMLSGPDVPFQQIDTSLLIRFKIYLKAQKGASDRTVSCYLVTVQTVFSQAIREELLDRKYFPFGKGKVEIFIPPSLKVGLGGTDVEKLEAVELSNPAHREALDLWLVSFYFAGMRASDAVQLRGSDFRDGRLHYVMDKNGKIVTLKVPEKALRILERYEAFQEGSGDFIFSYMQGLEREDDPFVLKKRIQAVVTNCDRLLKNYVAPAAGINGKLTMHVSRHTFATLAGDKIPIQMLQKLYRHSDIKTTLGYQSSFLHKDMDDALNIVLGG